MGKAVKDAQPGIPADRLRRPLNLNVSQMHPPKVVLVSSRQYSSESDDVLLRELIEAKIELFCAVGRDAERWEDAMDWLCIGP